MTTVVRLARAISGGLIVVFVLAAAISVVVGGVGIMNILLASVEQRTREIGVRMSVGARRADILGQFLVEALALGMTGSSVGVVVGLGIPRLARSLVRWCRSACPSCRRASRSRSPAPWPSLSALCPPTARRAQSRGGRPPRMTG